MKTTGTGTPCWVLSSHGHPCEAEAASETAVPPPRRPSAPPPRRHSRRAAQLDTYWMQADFARPEWPAAKRAAAG